MKVLTTILILAVVGLAGGALFVYCGAFDASADTPHSKFVYWLTQTARERSIAVRAKGIEIPRMEDPKLIAQGASQYAELCTGRHLAPGMEGNEMRPGLYPQPPNLSDRKHELETKFRLFDASTNRNGALRRRVLSAVSMVYPRCGS